MSVLITGANRGIGHGLFEHCSAAGDTVIGTSRTPKSPLVGLDVRDAASHRALAKWLDGQPIDLLICNAGSYADRTETLNTGYPADMWADTFSTNVAGVFHTIQNILPNLRASGSARIAIIASDLASHTNASGGSYIYCASKAAVLNLGRNLAVDLRADGIAIGIYHPGWVRTDMGGPQALISIADSVAGLTARFDALSMDNTGCFLAWDGSKPDY